MDVNQRLMDWGRWNRDAHGLGYPSSSAHTKAFEGGNGTHHDPDWPDDVLGTDEVMLSVKIQAPRYYRVLSAVYCDGVPEYKLSKEMRMPDRAARKLFDRAYGYVESLLM